MQRRYDSSPMKITNLMVLRPVSFFIVLASIVLLLPSVVLPFWITKVRRTEDELKFISQSFNQEIVSGIETKAKLLLPLNSSATSLASILGASLNETELSFPKIESKVAPLLFQAFSTIPYLSQVSYIGLDGLVFSYYNKGNQQPVAVYSNSSISTNQNTTTKYTWYSQRVSRNSGKPYGEAVSRTPSTADTSWIQFALKSKNGCASLGTAWNDAQDLLFLNTAAIDGRGALSLGFQVKSLIKFFFGIYGNGGSLYLATKDGEVLGEEMIPNTRMVIHGRSVSFQLLNPNGEQIGHVVGVRCQQNEGGLRDSILKIWETKYMVHCSPLAVVGVELVSVLVVPLKGPARFVQKSFNVAFLLLLLTIAAMLVSVICFVLLIVRGGRREMYLCAALIKQMEATQQAERKSMNKSIAFAKANHDVRSALAGITGLIEICRDEVAPESELEINLVQMKSCTKDLLGILNSILDTSKIEAGKMQLEEEEFEVAHLLEDVADLFHSVGMKKGVDVVLDLYDGSVLKFSHVKGDRVKLKQILCNLVSNAVKFTSEGNVSIRAWARKPTFENSILASTQNNPLTWLSCLFFKKGHACNHYEAMNAVEQDESRTEFVFEVDDTGKGIPKEKAKSVFENYVQVKETALGQGTGLGLGIVQSLVRLMGGEIVIVDKEVGKKGTCFMFNTYLSISETDNMAGNVREYDIESHGSHVSGESYQFSGVSTLMHSPKVEGSQVVLFIQSEERRKVSKKFMEGLGIKVSVVKHYEQLSTTLNNIKQKLLLSQYSSSSRSDVNSRSDCLSIPAPCTFSTRSKEVPLSSLDGSDQIPPTQRTNTKSTSHFILIVIDTNGGPFRELSRVVAEFRKNLTNICSRVVWIDKPGTRNIHFQGLEEDTLPPTDLIISKPFHGSRLCQVIGILPEFGGAMPVVLPATKGEITHWSAGEVPSETSSSRAQMRPNITHNSSTQNLQTLHGKIEEVGGTNNEKPLNGKNILVAEDDLVLRKIATSVISQLGATVEICGNGKEALEIVRKSLKDQKKHGAPDVLPYDYVFMDCEMPIMDGFEATRRIREEEEYYGVHIPIIAVSAHTNSPEIRMMIQAGMDCHLPKPLNPINLLQVIIDIHGR